MCCQVHGGQGQADDFPSVLELAYSLPPNGDDDLDTAVGQLATPSRAAAVQPSTFFQQTTVLSPAQCAEDREICMFALSACMAPVASQELQAPPSSPASSPFAFTGVCEDSLKSSGACPTASAHSSCPTHNCPHSTACASSFWRSQLMEGSTK